MLHELCLTALSSIWLFVCDEYCKVCQKSTQSLIIPSSTSKRDTFSPQNCVIHVVVRFAPFTKSIWIFCLFAARYISSLRPNKSMLPFGMLKRQVLENSWLWKVLSPGQRKWSLWWAWQPIPVIHAETKPTSLWVMSLGIDVILHQVFLNKNTSSNSRAVTSNKLSQQ